MGAGRVDGEVEADLAASIGEHPIGQSQRLGDVVGDQQGGKALVLPDALQQALHLDAGQGVERTQAASSRRPAVAAG